jgi:hydroxyacylglutathione hydrolase
VTQSKFELRTVEVGPWPVNTYVLVCPVERKSVLIDPGADPDILSDLLVDTDPVAILLTHSHPDHIGALDQLRDLLDVPAMAHSGSHYPGVMLNADTWLEDGDMVRVGRRALRVYHTPGHIGDLVCYALWGDDPGSDERVIVGDTLFEGGPGKTWSVDGFQTSLKTLREVVLAWPDEIVCYPGHGSPFRLGDIRTHVEEFLSKDHGDFFGDATWGM